MMLVIFEHMCISNMKKIFLQAGCLGLFSAVLYGGICVVSSPPFVMSIIGRSGSVDATIMKCALMTGTWTLVHAFGTLMIDNLLTTPPKVIRKLAIDLSKIELFVRTSSEVTEEGMPSSLGLATDADAKVSDKNVEEIRSCNSRITVYVILLVSDDNAVHDWLMFTSCNFRSV